MPTLNMGNGGLEGGSVKKVAKQPSGLIAAMKNAGLVLGIMGATVVTDANGQQVAVATAPQQPGQGGPVVPGKAESTVEEIPTAEMIIEILREGQDLIKKKFPNYNDAAFLRIVGEIGLGTVKPITLTGLAEAFTEEPEKRKAIIAFSKVINDPKPAPTLSSPEEKKKLPPLNESPEEKKMRVEEEKKEKMRVEMTANVSKNLMRKESWTVGTQGKASVDISKSGKDLIIIKYKPAKGNETPNQEGFANFRFQLPPGMYKIPVKTNTAEMYLWLTDANDKCLDMKGAPGSRIGLPTKEGYINFSVPTGTDWVTLGIKTNPMNQEITLEGLRLEALGLMHLAIKK